MKIKTLLFVTLAILSVTFSACKKNTEPPNNVTFKDLKVPADFTWSNINRLNLLANITDLNGNISHALDNQPLDLLDMEGNIMQRLAVDQASVEFYLMIDMVTTKVKLFSPVTQQTLEVDVFAGSVNFPTSLSKSALHQTDTDHDGIADEFDAFPLDPGRAFTNAFPYTTKALKEYPSGANYYFQIYEDLWPSMGDYDFNDLILANKLTWDYDAKNYIVGGSVTSKIWAIGESPDFPHGLGMETLKSSSSKRYYLPAATVNFSAGSIPQSHQDARMNNGVVMWDNIFEVLQPYYNNVGGDWGVMGVPKTVSYSYTMPASVKVKTVGIFSYLFNTEIPSWQIRTFGAPPASYADMALFRTGNDYSATTWNWATGSYFTYPLKGENAFYRTATNLPWGIEFIYSNFKVPIETTSILLAYPRFQAWAESGGTKEKTWYKYPDPNHTLIVPEN